jgi:hypothetical protein
MKYWNLELAPGPNMNISVPACVSVLASVPKCRLSSIAIIIDTMKIVPAGYGLDGRVISVRLPSGARKCSLLQCAQTGPRAYLASYPTGWRGFFYGVKRPGREANLSAASRGQF